MMDRLRRRFPSVCRYLGHSYVRYPDHSFWTEDDVLVLTYPWACACGHQWVHVCAVEAENPLFYSTLRCEALAGFLGPGKRE